MTRLWAICGGRRRGEIPQWLVWVAACVLLAASLSPLIGGLRFVSTAQHASGTIVEIVEVYELDQGEAYAPVVRFTTADSRQVQFQPDETAGDRLHYWVGQPVAVLYAADNPQRARMDTWQSRWGRDAIVPALGLLILIMAWIGQVQARRRARRRPPPPDVLVRMGLCTETLATSEAPREDHAARSVAGAQPSAHG